MMKLMNKKLTKKGFTLAELLIVVAILAILVAVSIPIFTGKLDDARKATDDANVRAAKAAAVAAYMSEADPGSAAAITYYYDAANGNVSKTNNLTKGYNKAKQNNVPAEEGIVTVTIGAAGANITATWLDVVS